MIRDVSYGLLDLGVVVRRVKLAATPPSSGEVGAVCAMLNTVALAVLLAVLLAGCGAGASAGAGESAGDQTESDSDTSADDSPRICSPELRVDVEETVRAQTRAISAGDYEKALEYSSNRYRSSTTPEIFGALIEDSYSYLITDNDYEFSDCYVYEDPELEVVMITAEFDDVALGYYLVEENGTWQIDLAGAPSVAPGAQPSV